METISNAVLVPREFNPMVLIPIVASTVLYRAVVAAHRRAPDRFGFSQLSAFSPD